jgi:hypothetical protein
LLKFDNKTWKKINEIESGNSVIPHREKPLDTETEQDEEEEEIVEFENPNKKKKT